MASLQERRRADGSIAYRVLYRHGGKQKAALFDNPTAQRRFKADIDRLGIDAALDILASLDDPGRAPTLGDYLERHISALSGVTDGTRHTYRHYAKEIAATPLGRTPIDAITREAISMWVTSLEGTLAGKSIRNRHALISAALARAASDELVKSNRAKGVRIAETVTDEMVILSPDEVQRIVAHAPDHYKPVVMFLYSTGLRFGEMSALKASDIRLYEKPATVSVVRAWKKGPGASFVIGPPKTKRGRRTLALPGSLVALLAPVMAGRSPDEWLFVNAAGNALQQSSFGKEWRRWRKKAALGKEPRVHDLRHSHASYMIGQGMNLLDLQHRLGHESLKTTGDTYGHLLPEAQVQAARFAESMFVPAPLALPPA